MKYLIDTCVLSECIKKTPNSRIENWFNQQQHSSHAKRQHTPEIEVNVV